MKLYGLDKYVQVSEDATWYYNQLKAKLPHLSEAELEQTIKVLFYNGYDAGVTEALDEILESDEPLINELNLAQIAMRSMKIKSKQKKANSLKIKAVELDSAAEIKRDKVTDGPGKEKGGFDRSEKKDIRDKITAKTDKRKSILKRKEDELERQVDDKTDDSNFLDRYKSKLRNKGTIAALDAELASAEAEEAKIIKRALKDKKRKDAEIEAEIKAEKEKLEKAEAKRKENEEIKAERTKAKERAKTEAETETTPEAETETTPEAETETTPEAETETTPEEEDTDEDTPKK